MRPPAHPGIVVIGDSLLDRDIEGSADRLSPDAPVPVLDEHARRSRPGGAALTAALAAGEGDPTTLITAVGSDDAGDELRRLLEASGVVLIGVPSAGPTPEKIRLLAGERPLLRLDRGGPASPPGRLPVSARRALEDAAVVVVSDYGRGSTADTELRAALEHRQRTTVWDPHPRGSEPVGGVTLVTPNLSELRAGFDGWRPPFPPGQGIRGVVEAAAAARRAWRAQAVAATLGCDGALLVDGEGPPLAVPAEPAASGDPCGAGDRFVAAAAARLLHGALVSEAVIEAVSVASRFVAAGGAYAFRPGSGQLHPPEGPRRQRWLGGQISPPPPAAGGVDDPLALAERVRREGGTLVVAGGCFDLIHAGHVALLESARRLGDCLIVALNSDSSVRRLKGGGRPVVTQADRAALLNALSCVDAVAIFDEDSPAQLLSRLRPDVFAKGGDYSSRPLPEEAVLAGWGGQTVVLPYLSGRSTTGLLELVGDLP